MKRIGWFSGMSDRFGNNRGEWRRIIWRLYYAVVEYEEIDA